jgi:RHS repeat-associated protein
LYLYDAAGQRVKKLVVTGNGYRTTTYLGEAFEHHTERNLDGTLQAENCSLHVMDDQSRIAIKRVGVAFVDDGAAVHPVQYHLGDHLGSSGIVVSGNGEWMNREEFFPYGETSFGSFGRKRYRFTGKERDEENGLSYHSARYYVLWLGRWNSTDPLGANDHVNLYGYSYNSPLRYSDPSGLAGDESGIPSDAGTSNISNTPSSAIASYTDKAPNGEKLPGGVIPTNNVNNNRKPTSDKKSVSKSETPSVSKTPKSVQSPQKEAPSVSKTPKSVQSPAQETNTLPQAEEESHVSKMRQSFKEKDDFLYGPTNESEKTIDCSGLVGAMLNKAYEGFSEGMNKDLSKWKSTYPLPDGGVKDYPAGGADQLFNYISSGESPLGKTEKFEGVNLNTYELKPGDIVFWDYRVGTETDKRINHVAVILSPTELAHSRGNPGADDSGPTISNPQKQKWLNDMGTGTTTKIYVLRKK